MGAFRRTATRLRRAKALRWAKALLRDESGPAATEYAVLTGVIVVGVLLAMSSFGEHLNGIYLAIAGVMQSVP